MPVAPMVSERDSASDMVDRIWASADSLRGDVHMDSSARSRLRARLLPGIALLAAATAAAACTSPIRGRTSAPLRPATSAETLQDSYESVVRAVLPSVVQISTDDSTGSGVVYDTEGDVVTNEHVVGDAKSVQVLLAGGNALTATVIGEFK